MEPANICRFCKVAAGEYQHIGVDQPFMSSDSFLAIASIGALVEGWALIIPKEHQLSMKKGYGNPEFHRFLGQVIQRLLGQYGPLITFEHGSNREGSITACGTDHAHLHVVPFGQSLLPDLQCSGLRWERCRASDISDCVQNREYLFYSELENFQESSDLLGYLHVLENPISQFFRQVIATKTGKEQYADYRQFPFMEIARKTRQLLIGA